MQPSNQSSWRARRPELGAHAPVGQHGPGPAAVGERDHHAGPPRQDRPGELHSPAGEFVGHHAARGIGRPRRDQAGPAAQRGDPRGDVGRLPAGADRGGGGGVGLRRDGPGQRHDHVEVRVPQYADHPRGRRISVRTGPPPCQHRPYRSPSGWPPPQPATTTLVTPVTPRPGWRNRECPANGGTAVGGGRDKVNGQGAPATLFIPDLGNRPGFTLNWQFPKPLACGDGRRAAAPGLISSRTGSCAEPALSAQAGRCGRRP